MCSYTWLCGPRSCKFTPKVGLDRLIACVRYQPEVGFRLKQSAFISGRAPNYRCKFTFTVFRMFNANETQDFTCELPSTGRHFTMRGEEGPGPWAPLAVLLRWISEILPHYNLRVHHEGSMNLCKNKKRMHPSPDHHWTHECDEPHNGVCRWMAISKCFISLAFVCGYPLTKE